MDGPAGLDPDDWTMWRETTRMHAAVERALEHRLQADSGLSTADFEVLRVLAAADQQRLRSGALAEALGWEKSRISHQVRRMADRGLLGRTDCPTDARGTWVVLAPAGADAFAAGACGYAEVLQAAVFDRVEAGQRTVLREVAGQVRQALGRSVRGGV